MVKRKAAEASSFIDTLARHALVEGTYDAGSQPHFLSSDLLLHASRGGFRNGLEQESKELHNEEHLGPGESRFEERTFIPQFSRTTPQTVKGKLEEVRLLLVDGPVPSKTNMKEAAAMGAAITQANVTSLFTVAKEDGASTSDCSEPQLNCSQREPKLFAGEENT